MEDKDMRDIMNKILAETILKAITDSPTDKALDSDSISEKKMAWIELHEDELDKAYDMSQEYREYGKL